MSTNKPGLITRFSKFLYTQSNWKIGLLATALFSGYLAFLSTIGKSFEVSGGAVKSLGTTLSFGVKDVTGFFTERSDQMISSYITFNQVWDFIFAIIYGFMYVIWLSVIYKPYSQKFWLVNLLPFGQVIFDWIENLSLVSLSKAYLIDESISTSNVMIASLASSIKWGISLLVYLVIIHGIVLRSARVITDRRKN
jgi:hypothetical protein